MLLSIKMKEEQLLIHCSNAHTANCRYCI